MTTSSGERESYSQAFERFVERTDDLQGLLAYALYKQSIREAVIEGRPARIAGDRTPTATEITAYRGRADSMLIKFADSIVDQSRTEITDTAVRADLREVEGRLTNVVQNATRWSAAVATNLVAWLISIAISVLLLLAGGPSWIAPLVKKLNGAD